MSKAEGCNTALRHSVLPKRPLGQLGKSRSKILRQRGLEETTPLLDGNAADVDKALALVKERNRAVKCNPWQRRLMWLPRRGAFTGR